MNLKYAEYWLFQTCIMRQISTKIRMEQIHSVSLSKCQEFFFFFKFLWRPLNNKYFKNKELNTNFLDIFFLNK